MIQSVKVLRLEAQLTIASRHDKRLRDVWVAIERGNAGAGWLAAFGQVADGEAARLSPSGRFEFVPLGASSGWIVAIGVDYRLIREADVEGLARRMVAEANERALEVSPESEVSAEIQHWTSNARSALKASVNAISGWRRPRASENDVALGS